MRMARGFESEERDSLAKTQVNEEKKEGELLTMKSMKDMKERTLSLREAPS